MNLNTFNMSLIFCAFFYTSIGLGCLLNKKTGQVIQQDVTKTFTLSDFMGHTTSLDVTILPYFFCKGAFPEGEFEGFICQFEDSACHAFRIMSGTLKDKYFGLEVKNVDHGKNLMFTLLEGDAKKIINNLFIEYKQKQDERR